MLCINIRGFTFGTSIFEKIWKKENAYEHENYDWLFTPDLSFEFAFVVYKSADRTSSLIIPTYVN